VPEYLFVTNSGSGDLTVIDIESRSVVARVAVGQDPQDVVITPDNQYALVLNRKSGDIAVIRIPSIGVSRSDRAMPGWIRRSASSSLFSMIPVGVRPISATISRMAS
jgi:YVTN family beta-propeller protein